MEKRNPKLQKLLDSLPEYKKMEREKKSLNTLEEILDLVWDLNTQTKVQNHLGISTSQSTITKFIDGVTGWEIKKISDVNTLKDKLIKKADSLVEKEISKISNGSAPVSCSEETLQTIYEQQKAKKMVFLDVIEESNVIRTDSPIYLKMIRAAAVRAIPL